jgi:hypothetical protein
MNYRIVAASWRKLGTPTAFEARTPAEALSKVRGLRSLGCEVTITGPDGEFVSQGELEILHAASLASHSERNGSAPAQAVLMAVVGAGVFALATYLIVRF